MGGAKLKKAEEFLIAANWNLLKSGQSGPDDGRAGGDETLVTREELDRYIVADVLFAYQTTYIRWF